jgi:hypothetical protein
VLSGLAIERVEPGTKQAALIVVISDTLSTPRDGRLA